MKIIIIDDESPARELIKIFLEPYADIEIAGEADNGFEAMKLIREISPQLIFLDVQMPKLTGFEMLELLDDPPAVIFSTAYDNFAIRAFEQNAVDYLLKPYSSERFDAAMQKAMARIKSGEPAQPELQTFRNAYTPPPGELTRIAVKDRQQIHVIPIDDIYSIEACGDYVTLHAASGDYLKEKTMKYFEENLPAQQFVRIHRSHIVNVNRVSKIERYEKDSYRVHLKNGVHLKASSGGYRALKTAVRL